MGEPGEGARRGWADPGQPTKVRPGSNEVAERAEEVDLALKFGAWGSGVLDALLMDGVLDFSLTNRLDFGEMLLREEDGLSVEGPSSANEC